ncbi:MAG: hypothetical protein QF631_04350 [Arenicellales bacterium]|nr:hypothetical protein [Arenicellales bacterium]
MISDLCDNTGFLAIQYHLDLKKSLLADEGLMNGIYNFIQPIMLNEAGI